MNRTRILRLSVLEPVDQKVIAEAAVILQEGGLVVIPTDTVYGTAAHWKNAKAVERLRLIKGRPFDKPIAILASDRMKIEKTGAHFGRNAEKLARRFWPGPLTIVLPVDGGWEGFRIPNHAVALALISAAGGLLRVTSANLSGRNPALTAEEALRELGSGVDLIIDCGPAAGSTPSTVVKIEYEKAVILREGAITRDAIYEVCGQEKIQSK